MKSKPPVRVGVAEWLMAPVLKTGGGQPSVGSNPTSDASAERRFHTAVWLHPTVFSFPGGWTTVHPPNAAIAGHKPGSETQSGHPFTTPYHHIGGKRRKKSSVFNGLRGVTLKENLCKNNVAKNLLKLHDRYGDFYSPEEGDDVSVYEFEWVRGHVEVFLDGVFQFSADNMKEAHDELDCELHAKR